MAHPVYEKVKIPRFLVKHAVLLHFYLENEAYIFNDIPNFFNYFINKSLSNILHNCAYVYMIVLILLKF